MIPIKLANLSPQARAAIAAVAQAGALGQRRAPKRAAAAAAKALAPRPSLPPAAVAWHDGGRSVALWIPGDPPVVTHQAKRIERRRTHMALVDSPALNAAVNRYLLQIPQARHAALDGAVDAWVVFVFPALPGEPAGQPCGWHVDKPDLDNAAKTLLDRVVERGYLADDRLVAQTRAAKLRGAHAGVAVLLRPLTEIPDELLDLAFRGPGRLLAGELGRRPGHVLPAAPGTAPAAVHVRAAEGLGDRYPTDAPGEQALDAAPARRQRDQPGPDRPDPPVPRRRA